MKIAFLGDISFNDAYIGLHEKGINPFEAIASKLKACEQVIGNLECIAKGDKGENELKKPRLKTTKETLGYLTNLNVSAVTLAHNHIFDNLQDGFEKTLSSLKDQNIQYLGASLEKEKASKAMLLEQDGIKVCLLSYVHADTNPNLPANCPIHLNMYDKEKIIGDIKQYKELGFTVIPMLHWGGRFEGGKYPDKYQPRDAKVFIQAGADLIIGHHSHTLQPSQKIKEKQVFYSLGNFCFADIVFEGKVRNMSKPRYRESVIPMVEFKSNSEYSVDYIPIKNENLSIVEAPAVLKTLKRRNLVQRLFSVLPFLWCFYKIQFKAIMPIWNQLTRKDAEKSLWQRIFSLNTKKIKSLLKL